MAINGAEDYDKAKSNEMNMLNDIDVMVREIVKNIEEGTVTSPAPSGPETPTNPWGKDDLEEVKVKDEAGNDVSVPSQQEQQY